MPLKWLILGAFVAGLTVANIVNASRNNSTSGCSFLGSNNASTNANSSDSTSGRNQPDGSTANANGGSTDDGSGSDSGSGGDTADNANGTAANSNVNGGADSGSGNTNGDSDGGSGNGNDNSAPANQNSNTGGNDQTNNNGTSNTNDNGEDTSSPSITGRFAGTLRRENAQSLGGDLPPPRVTNSSQAMEFGDNFLPLVIMVINYAGAPDRPLTNVRQGDTQTLTATLGTKQITLDVTVREASYQRRSMRTVLDIRYRSTSGNLTETGTGVQTIECSVDAGGNLTISSGIHYEVRLSAGGIVFNTIEETTMTGTLNRE